MNKTAVFAALIVLAPAAHAGLFGSSTKACDSEIPETRDSVVSHLYQGSPQESWTYSSSTCIKEKKVRGISFQDAHAFGDNRWHWVDAKSFQDHGFRVAPPKPGWGEADVEYLPSRETGTAGEAAENVYLRAQAEANAKRMEAGDLAPAGCARHADFVGRAAAHKQAVSVCLVPWPGGEIAASAGYQADDGAWKWLSAENLFAHNLILTQAGIAVVGHGPDKNGLLWPMYGFAQELGASDGYAVLKIVESRKQAASAAAAKARKALKAAGGFPAGS